MYNPAIRFFYHMTIALHEQQVESWEFHRHRGYAEFKADVKQHRDERSIALSELRNGTNGPMDCAVIQAVVGYLDEQFGGSADLEERCTSAMSLPTQNLKQCLLWVHSWYGA
jgi:hypothetical protein